MLTDLKNRLGIMQDLEDLVTKYSKEEMEFLVLFVDNVYNRTINLHIFQNLGV